MNQEKIEVTPEGRMWAKIAPILKKKIIEAEQKKDVMRYTSLMKFYLNTQMKLVKEKVDLDEVYRSALEA